jgi:hypothetical protein
LEEVLHLTKASSEKYGPSSSAISNKIKSHMTTKTATAAAAAQSTSTTLSKKGRTKGGNG